MMARRAVVMNRSGFSQVARMVGKDLDKYQGATVIDPRAQDLLCVHKRVFALDFMSLYPTCDVWMNICASNGSCRICAQQPQESRFRSILKRPAPFPAHPGIAPLINRPHP